MAIKRILLATSNKGKTSDIALALKDTAVEVLDLSNFNLRSPVEYGESFEDNALIKANYYSKRMNENVLSDDSGLCIEALDWKPGVHTAIWAKDRNIFEKLQKMIKRTKSNNFNAIFICILCYKKIYKEPIFFEGKISGKVTFPPKGENGFGFDPIFIPDGTNKTFAEMSKAEKLKFSSRGIALEKFKHYLLNA
jgi:XTP/dITP diphosphohydrolase